MSTQYKTRNAAPTRYTRHYPGTYAGRAYAATRPQLTRTGKQVRALVILILALVATFVIVGQAAQSSSTEVEVTYTYVAVPVNGSLWGIATTYFPERDPRDVVAEIVSLNGLASANVVPGQQLALPPK